MLDKAGEQLAASQFAAAAATLREVVALDPENGWAHGRLGYAQIATHQLADAQQSFRRQYELGHERAGALYNLACAQALSGEPELT